jgi:formylglycine-generating enzyme required for sulfatase activity
MKKAILQIIVLVLGLTARSQTISNFRLEQVGQQVHVYYSLTSSSACEVQLMVSTDNGKTWSGPLTQVSGDVGKNITAGNKQITWNVLEERDQLVGDQIRFKVVANGKKSFEPEMVFVEGGTFQMGSSSGDSDEQPVHSVTLSSFSIGKYEVTQAQWKAVMGNNPSNFGGCDNCPVETVSWNDVQEFIRKLNAQTGKNYRLPTEAEWEFAAMGGNKSEGFIYSGSNNIEDVAWCDANGDTRTNEVGKKKPNELGIYDMSGNVQELCVDFQANYTNENQTNPNGPNNGPGHIMRGGGYNVFSAYAQSKVRNNIHPESVYSNVGLRLVLPNYDIKIIEPEMVFVEGGTFQMGSNFGESDEKPVHSVTLKSFYMGKHEITQAQWRVVMGSNATHNNGCENCPVVLVSWREVQEYIQELNAQTGKKYRLPTEAEWEYAAKGGKASKGFTYSGSNDIGTVAWYYDNCENKGHVLGGKLPNELGIYDMSGNVSEWCSDWYGNYSSLNETNPKGALVGNDRVLRGGGCSDSAANCRSTNRNWGCTDCGSNFGGFRLVLPADR